MSKTKQLVFCSLFTALIAVGAFIKIPVPVVPFTLQYLFTMLAGLILGPRLGTISVTAYMLLGLAGLPIFTEGGGLWYVLKPSFGYIIGFCIGTYVTGTLAAKLKKRTFARYLAANLAGLAVVYAAQAQKLIGELVDARALAAHRKDFQAVVVVQVHVHG